MERADEQGDDAAERVGEKDELFAENAGTVGIGVAEVGVLNEGEDDEGGDTHEDPEGGFSVGARAQEGASMLMTLAVAPIVRECVFRLLGDGLSLPQARE